VGAFSRSIDLGGQELVESIRRKVGLESREQPQVPALRKRPRIEEVIKDKGDRGIEG